jgi:twinkle protein
MLQASGAEFGFTTTEDSDAPLFTPGQIKALTKRGINEDTARKFDYRVAKHAGKTCQVANYYKDQRLVAQKLRYPDKTFAWIGNASGLYGQWLWRDSGKMVVVTEGELDCLSVSMLQGNKWPTVSVKNGAQGAKRDIQKALEWLESYETVVFMFDMDEPGQAAARACASVLTPGKAKIAQLPLKDANEMLLANRGKEVISAIWEAKTFRPDGIVSGADIWADVATNEVVYSVDYPFNGLTEKTHGLRKSELTTITAGSGIGKSALVREIGYDLVKKGERVGFIMLEETVKRTALGLMGLHLDKPIHLGLEPVEPDDLKEAFSEVIGNGRVFFYDAFGSTAIENLLSRIKFLAKGAECDWVILDHLSIVVSGLGDGDERRLIDNAMTALRTLVQETGVGLILVSHLKRPEGSRGHEEGAQTSLSQLRGSHAIAQLSDMVLGLERNQQGEEANVTTVRVLKNRFSGETGIACHVKYNPDTGRLNECSLEFEEEDNEF